VITNTDWMDTAACRLDDAWTDVPEGHKAPSDETLRRLKAVCKTCPVLTRCAEYAVANHLDACVVAGVWVPPRAGQGKAVQNVGYLHVMGILQRLRRRVGAVVTCVSDLEYCRYCRQVQRFAILTGSMGAPDFNCCQVCGDGYCVTPEVSNEEGVA
jgi:hypothetical protein